MDYSDIVFTLEFDDDGANYRANDFLSKGWKLVVGATKEQYEGYLIQEEEDLKESQRITDRFTD